MVSLSLYDGFLVFLDTNILLCEFDCASTIEQFTRDRSDMELRSGNMCAVLVLSDILGRFNLIFTDDFISSTFDRYALISTPFYVFSPI